MTPPAFAVAGWKDSGKTTLVERLVAHLTARGMNVGTVKRSHDAFLMDVEGTDTDRHRRAGARSVAMIGPNGWTLARSGGEPAIETVLAAMTESDVVVVEGLKRGALPTIEVVADPSGEPIRAFNPHVFAVACDDALAADLPVLRRDDIAGLAELALARLGLGPRPA